MKIRIICRKHNDAPVLPAATFFHWMFVNQTDPEQPYQEQLDKHDLFCTVNIQDGTNADAHDFVAIIESSKVIKWNTGRDNEFGEVHFGL